MKVRIPKEFGGGPNQNMLKQVQKMQDDMAAKQAELEEMEFETSAGGGAVKVTISGKKEVKSIKIDKDVVDPDDIEMLQDMICAAVNEAIKKVEDTANEEMSKITGRLNIPGIPGLF